MESIHTNARDMPADSYKERSPDRGLPVTRCTEKTPGTGVTGAPDRRSRLKNYAMGCRYNLYANYNLAKIVFLSRKISHSIQQIRSSFRCGGFVGCYCRHSIDTRPGSIVSRFAMARLRAPQDSRTTSVGVSVIRLPTSRWWIRLSIMSTAHFPIRSTG